MDMEERLQHKLNAPSKNPGLVRMLQLLLLPLLLASCAQKGDKLVGHWHSIPNEGLYYWTLDITDSTTQANKYELEYWGPAFPRTHDSTGQESIFVDFEEYRDIELRGDTLYLTEQFKFIRIQEDHHLNDRFPGSLVHLNLPKPTGTPIVKLPRPSNRSHIYIGPAKHPSESHYFNADSTCFQVTDFIATGLVDLVYFMRQEDAAIAANENNWLIIHADSSTSKATLDTLMSVLDPLDLLHGYILSRYNYDLDEMVYEEF